MDKDLFNKFFTEHFSLETPRVILRPMVKEDYELYLPLCSNSESWTYFTADLSDPVELLAWMEQSLKEKSQFVKMPFTIYDKDTGLVCGSSSYGNISFYDKRLEIGWSFLGPESIGTGVNKQAKFALLSYAFEIMRMERVEMKTDLLNERSKAAMLKVGMIPEGVLRSHMLVHSNRRRDTIYFSLLKEEWEARKQSFFAELM